MNTIRHAAPIATLIAIGALAALAAAATPAAPATPLTPITSNEAKGTLVYKARTTALKYVFLVKGPHFPDPSKTERKLIFSAKNIGAELQACTSMSCAKFLVREGMTVDFDVSPRLEYWLAVNGQKVQYSGAAMPDAFKAKVNDSTHLGGKLVIDDVAADGPKVDVEFNVSLFKQFTQ